MKTDRFTKNASMMKNKSRLSFIYLKFGQSHPVLSQVDRMFHETPLFRFNSGRRHLNVQHFVWQTSIGLDHYRLWAAKSIRLNDDLQLDFWLLPGFLILLISIIFRKPTSYNLTEKTLSYVEIWSSSTGTLSVCLLLRSLLSILYC